MANADKSKIIRIYGVTLADSNARTRPYGHGMDKIDGVSVQYVDYFIDDLISSIKNQKLQKIIKKLLDEEDLQNGGIRT